MKASVSVIDGPVGPTLTRLAAPMVLGLLSVILFNVVDTFWVGQLGARELAAMSFTFPVSFIVLSITIGLGIGATSVVARAIGAGDQERAARLTTDALLLSVLVITILAAIGRSVIDPVFLAMGATEDLLPLIRAYMLPWLYGIGVLVLPLVGNAATRATGDTKTPAIIMMISGLLNLILDPLMIFGIGPFPKLGLAGAAYASILSWTLAFAAAFWMLGFRDRLLLFTRPTLARVKDSWWSIVYVGAPAAGTQLLVPLSAAVLTRFVAEHGHSAVAAFGVSQRVESLAVVGMLALGTAMTAFAGQNEGAGRIDRLRESVTFAAKSCALWGGSAAILLGVLARPVAELFADDPAIVDVTVLYLRIVPFSYLGFGFAVVINSMLSGMNRPGSAGLLIVVRLFVLALPLAWLGSRVWGPPGIFAGVAASNLGSGLFAYVSARRITSTPSNRRLALPPSPRPADPG